MEPILLKSIVVGESETGKPLMAGFEQVDIASLDVAEVLAPKQYETWMELDTHFTFDDIKRKSTSRAAAHRLRERLIANHMIRELEKDTYEKLQ